ncbi:hypothetical protein Tco_1418971 [Tanacetum coccineum]
MHVVPPPMTGNYMPSGPDVEIDYSQFTYGPNQSQPSESETQTSDFDTCESDCSVETHESLPEPTVNEPKVVNQPKVRSDAPIIEEYESDNEDEHVPQPTKEQEQPSFASTNKQVKTPRKTDKNQFTHSKNPTVDKKGLGYGFTARACFVCSSLSHLIRDCVFHEKRMAKQAELNNSMMMKSSQREIRPIWNNVQRVNHKNQFVPTAVLTRTGKILVNTARASGTNKVSTARHDLNRQAVLTNAAMKVNTDKPVVNRVRPANVNTAEVNAVSVVGGKRETAVKPSDYPHRTLKHKGIIDSRCSRHMTRNKAYLAAYQDFNKVPRPSEYVPDPMELEDHVPMYVPEPEHPEDLVPVEDEAPIEPYITEVASASTPLLPPPSLLPTLIRPPHTRASMAQMRATTPSIYHSLLPAGTPPLLPIPLPAPSTSRRADIPEADTPPRKRLLLTAPTPRVKVGESSVAAAARQPGSTMARRVDYSFIDIVDTWV